ncbi:hypothetical protein B0T17DRAFT_637493 [Bombardia bombarda]|uniref:Uncharacterized protein n=1 Tax=Bombardia bombarda TaxID=252184 RepID=A0AA40CA85_9PEZI|nr:hypothetical protein B0T17DRAFT_637493 [Bombardia bombarda]
MSDQSQRLREIASLASQGHLLPRPPSLPSTPQLPSQNLSQAPRPAQLRLSASSGSMSRPSTPRMSSPHNGLPSSTSVGSSQHSPRFLDAAPLSQQYLPISEARPAVVGSFMSPSPFHQQQQHTVIGGFGVSSHGSNQNEDVRGGSHLRNSSASLTHPQMSPQTLNFLHGTPTAVMPIPMQYGGEIPMGYQLVPTNFQQANSEQQIRQVLRDFHNRISSLEQGHPNQNYVKKLENDIAELRESANQTREQFDLMQNRFVLPDGTGTVDLAQLVLTPASVKALESRVIKTEKDVENSDIKFSNLNMNISSANERMKNYENRLLLPPTGSVDLRNSNSFEPRLHKIETRLREIDSRKAQKLGDFNNNTLSTIPQVLARVTKLEKEATAAKSAAAAKVLENAEKIYQDGTSTKNDSMQLRVKILERQFTATETKLTDLTKASQIVAGAGSKLSQKLDEMEKTLVDCSAKANEGAQSAPKLGKKLADVEKTVADFVKATQATPAENPTLKKQLAAMKKALADCTEKTQEVACFGSPMRSKITEVENSVANLMQSNQAVTTSVYEMGRKLADVDRNVASLMKAKETATASIPELGGERLAEMERTLASLTKANQTAAASADATNRALAYIKEMQSQLTEGEETAKNDRSTTELKMACQPTVSTPVPSSESTVAALTKTLQTAVSTPSPSDTTNSDKGPLKRKLSQATLETTKPTEKRPKGIESTTDPTQDPYVTPAKATSDIVPPPNQCKVEPPTSPTQPRPSCLKARKGHFPTSLAISKAAAKHRSLAARKRQGSADAPSPSIAGKPTASANSVSPSGSQDGGSAKGLSPSPQGLSTLFGPSKFLNFLKDMNGSNEDDIMLIHKHVVGQQSLEFPLCEYEHDGEHHTLFLKIGGRLRNQLRAGPREEMNIKSLTTAQPIADYERATELKALECFLVGSELGNNDHMPQYMLALGEVYVAARNTRSASTPDRVSSTNFFVTMDIKNRAKGLWMVWRYDQFVLKSNNRLVGEHLPFNHHRSTRGAGGGVGHGHLFGGVERVFDNALLLASVNGWKAHDKPMLDSEGYVKAFHQGKRSVLEPTFAQPILKEMREILKKSWAIEDDDGGGDKLMADADDTE